LDIDYWKLFGYWPACAKPLRRRQVLGICDLSDGLILSEEVSEGYPPMEFKTVLTTCPYCGCGCGLLLEVLDGKVIGTLPSKTSPVNEGKLCVKGWTVHEFVTSPNRLTKPMVRKTETLEDASWNEALDLAAKRLKEIKEKYGPDSIGVLTSAKCTNEENYLLQKFTRAAIGTNNIDHCARL
jgi:predicted molibdopterin-dependent oxidoreductase YjgC